MKHRTIPVKNIHPNPHRDFKRNPIPEDQVQAVLDSIDRTGFWDNIVVRPHPEKKGEYQLAYGHSRLAAVRRKKFLEITVPVADLNDWDMLCAMVDENETQRTVPPKVVVENVEAGLKLLEKAFKTIGPEGTEKEFWRAAGTSLSRDKEVPDKHDGSFIQVRNGFFAGKGIGVMFLQNVLPGYESTRLNVLQSVVNSHYGEEREQAKRKEAEKEDKEARKKEEEAKAKKARGEKEEAERLQKEALEAQKRAARLRAEAERISERTVSTDILIKFDTRTEMAAFDSAVASIRIPKSHHKAAMEYASTNNSVSSKNMDEKLNLWWYERSGQKAHDIRVAERETAYRTFIRRTDGGDFQEFLTGLLNDVRDLDRKLDIALEGSVATFYENERHKAAALEKIAKLQAKLTRLEQDLKKPRKEIKVIGGEPRTDYRRPANPPRSSTNERDFHERIDGRSGRDP
jgi:hypothetical protein